MKLIQDICRVFLKWFDGEQLRGDEVETVTYCIIIGLLLLLCIVLLAKTVRQSHVLRSIKWFCEDVWRMIKR